MEEGNTGGFAEKINYGEKCGVLFDCSLEVGESVYSPLSTIRELDKQLRNMKKRKGIRGGFGITDEYKSVESKVSEAREEFKKSRFAENTITIFNDKNKQEIELVEGDIKGGKDIEKYYDCKIKMPGDVRLEGDVYISPPFLSVTITLEGNVDEKPSTVFNSLEKLNKTGITYFQMSPEKEETMIFKPRELLRISTKSFCEGKIGEILDGKTRGEIRLKENSLEPSFQSQINFEPGKKPKVNIEYKIRDVLNRQPEEISKEKEWRQKNVNTLMSFKPKPVN